MTRNIEDRPEWVKCVQTGMADEPRLAWCGKGIGIFDFHFVDASHAALNGRQKGRLVACRECVAEITNALLNGHEEQK